MRLFDYDLDNYGTKPNNWVLVNKDALTGPVQQLHLQKAPQKKKKSKKKPRKKKPFIGHESLFKLLRSCSIIILFLDVLKWCEEYIDGKERGWHN